MCPVTPFKVVVTDALASDVEVEREVIAAAGGVIEVPVGSRDDILAAARDADGILNTYFALDRSAIGALARCRIIARYGIGVDNVDITAAAEAGIAVTNVPDYCVEEVATHALAYVLALVRRMKRADDLVRGGQWGVGHLGSIHRMSSLTVGLVGYGKIARRLRELIAPFRCSILVFDPYVREVADTEELVALPELLGRSDIVSLHCPLTDETRNMVNASTLAQMRDGAFVVNVSRGPLIVLDDLVEALRSGKLGGAGLDTFAVEPPPSAVLSAVPGLITSPHSAYYSSEAVQESRQKAASQVIKALVTGEPLDYRVN
jgi:D-3-phosphoglycerate dehydrogenase